jgi:hypothetical protein
LFLASLPSGLPRNPNVLLIRTHPNPSPSVANSYHVSCFEQYSWYYLSTPKKYHFNIFGWPHFVVIERWQVKIVITHTGRKGVTTSRYLAAGQNLSGTALYMKTTCCYLRSADIVRA